MKVIKCEQLKGINAQKHRKEKKFFAEYCAMIVEHAPSERTNNWGRISPIVTVRLYRMTPSKISVCVWMDRYDWNGSGECGPIYSSHSSGDNASRRAFDSAGITFDELGDIYHQVEAVCIHLGYENFYIHSSHA